MVLSVEDLPHRVVIIGNQELKVPKWIYRKKGKDGWIVILQGSYSAKDNGRDPKASLEEAKRVLNGWLSMDGIKELIAVRKCQEDWVGLQSRAVSKEKRSKRTPLGYPGVYLLRSDSSRLVVTVSIPSATKRGTRTVTFPTFRYPCVKEEIEQRVRLGVALRQWSMKEFENGSKLGLSKVTASNLPSEVYLLAAKMEKVEIDMVAIKGLFQRKAP